MRMRWSRIAVAAVVAVLVGAAALDPHSWYRAASDVLRDAPVWQRVVAPLDIALLVAGAAL